MVELEAETTDTNVKNQLDFGTPFDGYLVPGNFSQKIIETKQDLTEVSYDTLLHGDDQIDPEALVLSVN